jgi:hypothetical protein
LKDLIHEKLREEGLECGEDEDEDEEDMEFTDYVDNKMND